MNPFWFLEGAKIALIEIIDLTIFQVYRASMYTLMEAFGVLVVDVRKHSNVFPCI